MDDNIDLEVNETARKYNVPERYTYSDYASWDDENRYELIDGIAYMMSAPTITHQSILGELYLQFATFLKGKKCRVFFAPFDVCLFGKGDDDYTVLQPDLLVVCDETILDEKRCNGAPDLVIEILSPSTSRRDRFIKLNKYLEAGVREFWIVEPEDKGVTVHILENGKYVISAYDNEKTIAVNILEGCNIVLPEIF
ncbi:MAG: Uma2 family endonuclease [Oscillospiraceae bacterium]|jgi:Uma2 family endonuclease|nr:Uma2 family endonuclease [Oscillospiraceae bacterium]